MDHSLNNGFYLHPLVTKETISFGIPLPTPKNTLSFVLPVFKLLLSEREEKYGYKGVEDVWFIADKI